MKVRHRQGGGNGNTVRYILIVNGADTDLFIDVPSTFVGETSKFLPMEELIDIPPDATLDIGIDKPDGGIDQSPIDCTVTVELL